MNVCRHIAGELPTQKERMLPRSAQKCLILVVNTALAMFRNPKFIFQQVPVDAVSNNYSVLFAFFLIIYSNFFSTSF